MMVTVTSTDCKRRIYDSGERKKQVGGGRRRGWGFFFLLPTKDLTNRWFF